MIISTTVMRSQILVDGGVRHLYGSRPLRVVGLLVVGCGWAASQLGIVYDSDKEGMKRAQRCYGSWSGHDSC